MGVYKQNKVWIVDVSYIDTLGIKQRHRKRSFNTKADALDYERKFLLDVSAINPYTFNDLILLYLSNKKNKIKERSLYDIKSTINSNIAPYFNDIKLKDITPNLIINYQQELLKKGYRNEYLSTIQGTLSSILNYGVTLSLLPNNPLLSIKFVKNINEPKQEMNYFTYDEYLRFRSELRDEYYELIFDMLYFTGMRIGELQALTWKDYRGDCLFLHSTFNPKTKKVSATTKTGENRYIYLSNNIIDQLEKLKSQFTSFLDYSSDKFIFGYYEPTPQKTITNHKDKAINDYNNTHSNKIPRIRIHDFRHSHVSLLINNGIDSFTIAERLGHSKQMVENRYGHLFPHNKQKVVNFLNNL